ncbi:unnamed protein product [Ixodes pacificus]
MAAVSDALLLTSGFLLRLALIYTSIGKRISDRVEVSTPLNSWRRVTEGLYLQRMRMSPYDGDVFHEPPLSLALYDGLTRALGDPYLPLFFVICDLVTALLLSGAAKKGMQFMVAQENQIGKAKSAEYMRLTEKSVPSVPKLVLAVYLLSPYSLLNCVGMATTTFSNLLLAAFLLAMVRGRWLLASVVLALEAYKSFYSVMLLVPALLYFVQAHRGTGRVFVPALAAVAAFVTTLGSLLYASFLATGSWKFLRSTYGCICWVPDLTPNIGLFWYFFTEVFEHFRAFFLWIFQLNAFVYILPLAIRLRKEPLLLLFIIAALTAVFKSYPSVGDVALYTALLPMWRHVFPYMKQYFLVACVFVACTALAPLLWHLWIYSSSANANFYFGITLAFNTGQIFLITDLLFAHVKRRYFLDPFEALLPPVPTCKENFEEEEENVDQIYQIDQRYDVTFRL